MDPVDQGTVMMLSLSFGLLAVALVYFACIWYRKRKSKSEQTIAITATAAVATTTTSAQIRNESKSQVNRTFSRFSQVDDECTFYGDDHDLELLKSFVEANKTKYGIVPPPNPASQIKRSRSAAGDSSTRIVRVTAQTREHRRSVPLEDRPYLETAI